MLKDPPDVAHGRAKASRARFASKGARDLVSVKGTFARGPQRPAQVYRAAKGFHF